MNESRITPKGIIDDAIGMIGKMQESAFPLDVFPAQIRTIILKMHEYLNFPIDYTACSMLCAIATGIGNTHILRFKKGWHVKCIMYMALVGRPGSNKSHPLKAAFKPFFNFDREQFRKFAGELRDYERIMNLSRKERTAQGHDICPAPPVRTRFLVSDITQEAMAKAISENPRGICLFMDELQGWINNFTRYNKGLEEQFYISLFNGSNYMSDCKGSMNNIHIDNPFSNIIGTIQPESIYQRLEYRIFTYHRLENRFTGLYFDKVVRNVVTAYAFFLSGIPFQIIRNFHMDIFLAHPGAFFFPFLRSLKVREQYYIPAL